MSIGRARLQRRVQINGLRLRTRTPAGPEEQNSAYNAAGRAYYYREGCVWLARATKPDLITRQPLTSPGKVVNYLFFARTRRRRGGPKAAKWQ